MPRTPPPLSPGEWEVMRYCWRLGAATTPEIHKEALRHGPWDLRNLLEHLRRLVIKGYLSSSPVRTPGRGRPLNKYTPLIDRKTGVEAAIERFVDEIVGVDPDNLEFLQEVLNSRLEELVAARRAKR